MSDQAPISGGSTEEAPLPEPRPTEEAPPADRPTRFVFLDTEATGLDLERHDLTEISWIVRFEDGREVERQYFPEHTLDAADEDALELTGYHERIADQPRTPMAEWLPRFLEDAEGAVLVGAVPDFDVRQVQKACRRLQLEPTWDHHLLDVETLALPLIAPGPEAPRSLARTCEALGVEHDEEQAHGALYDAQQVKRVFDAIWDRLAELRETGAPLPDPIPRRPRRPETQDAGAAQDPDAAEEPETTQDPDAARDLDAAEDPEAPEPDAGQGRPSGKRSTGS